jgi:hypothetical protein
MQIDFHKFGDDRPPPPRLLLAQKIPDDRPRTTFPRRLETIGNKIDPLIQLLVGCIHLALRCRLRGIPLRKIIRKPS